MDQGRTDVILPATVRIIAADSLTREALTILMVVKLSPKKSYRLLSHDSMREDVAS